MLENEFVMAKINQTYDICQYINCKNRASAGFKLFRFPKDVEKQQQWIERSGYFS